MVKHFNVIMAGLISGIVALFTSWLGISGTVIGSVLSSFLYQFFSSYSAEMYEERVDGGKTITQRISRPNVGSEIVYVFPIFVIAVIEVICILASLHYRFDMLFNLLEAAVSNNLFRLMGIGLIALGIYPLVANTNIEKINGKIVLVLGILLLFRGLVDISGLTINLYYMFFQRFDFIFAIIVALGLFFVVFNVLRNSAGEYLNKDKGNYSVDESNDDITNHKFSRPHRKSKARKIDTSFTKAEDDPIDNNFNNPNSRNYRGRENFASRDFDDRSYGYDDRSYGNDEMSYGYDDRSYAHDDWNRANDYQNRKINNRPPEDDLPIYEEEIIYVNNPDDPNNPIRKRILKRVNPNSRYDDYDDYDETYIIDENR